MSDSSADPPSAVDVGSDAERGRRIASVMLGEREVGWILRDERGESYVLANGAGAQPVPLDPARPLATQLPGGATIDVLAQATRTREAAPIVPVEVDPTLDVAAGAAARDADVAAIDADAADADSLDADSLDADGIDSDGVDSDTPEAERHDPDAAPDVAIEPAASEPPPPPPDPPDEALAGPEIGATRSASGTRSPRVGVVLDATAGHHVAGTTTPETRAAEMHEVNPADTRKAKLGAALAGASDWTSASAQALTLAEGSQSTGTIVAVTDDVVVQNGGRGSFYVHPRDAFYDATPTPGSSVTIENQGGRFAVMEQLERDPRDREQERERGGRTL